MTGADAVVLVVISFMIIVVAIYLYLQTRKAKYAIQFYTSVPLQSDFQLLVSDFPISAFGVTTSTELLNLRFCADLYCFTPVYAWIENVNNGYATIWFRIPHSVSADSSFSIYVYPETTIQYPYTGINAAFNWRYDNGPQVFDTYANFMGTAPVVSSPYQVYSNVTTKFVPPQNFNLDILNINLDIPFPGMYLTLDNQKSAYALVSLPTTKSSRIPEVFEGIAVYAGMGDFQGLVFFANPNSSINHICEPNKICGNFQTFSRSYNAMFDPYKSNTFISNGSGTAYSVTTETGLTNQGVNYYEVVVEEDRISFYGTAITTMSDMYNAKLLNVLYTPVTIYGSSFGFADSSGGISHIGAWLMVRARAYPPGGMMPQFVEVKKL